MKCHTFTMEPLPFVISLETMTFVMLMNAAFVELCSGALIVPGLGPIGGRDLEKVIIFPRFLPNATFTAWEKVPLLPRYCVMTEISRYGSRVQICSHYIRV